MTCWHNGTVIPSRDTTRRTVTERDGVWTDGTNGKNMGNLSLEELQDLPQITEEQRIALSDLCIHAEKQADAIAAVEFSKMVLRIEKRAKLQQIGRYSNKKA